MIRTILLSLTLFVSFYAFSSDNPIKHKVSGKVIDKTMQEPVSYATVSISQNETLIDGVITNEEGDFELRIPKGKYTLRVEFLSYTNYEQQIDVSSSLNLGTIELSESTEMLDEITVKSEKSSVNLNVDKKVFYVGKDLLSQSGSLSDVLGNVPSVSVNLDGAVSLRGNSNVSILINGKPSILTANNGLSQIPAEQIERVEVITNPSSRYQASGTSGIINVILKKNRLKGFSGSINVSNSVRADVNTSASLNYKTQKINLFSTFGYRFVDNRVRETVFQNSLQNNSFVLLDRNTNIYRNYSAKNMYLGFDYFLSENSTFTASYYKILVEHDNTARYRYDYSDAMIRLDSTTLRTESYFEPMDHNQLEISYVKDFDTAGKKLSIDFQYDFWDDDENENFVTQNTFPTVEQQVSSRTRDIESSKDFLLQIDFVNPFSEQSSFETGLRAETRIISSEYKAEIFENNQWNILNDIDNKLEYRERIAGAYALYNETKNRITYQFGLRVEYTNIDISDKNEEFKDTKSYTNFFPTAHFTYSLSDKTKAQLSYSRRINRPRFWHLNPFGGLAGINELRQGNPDMDPALTNALEISLLTKVGKLQLNPTVYYQNTVDPFQFFTERNSDGVLITKPINIDRESRFGFELSTTYKPYKWAQFMGEFNYFSFQQKGIFQNLDFDFDNRSWFARVNSRFKLSDQSNLQVNLNYNGRIENAQTVTKANYFLDLGWNRSFLQNKVALTFNIRNILDSRQAQILRTGENFSYESDRKLLGPKYTLTLIYRFNQKENSKTRRPGRSNR